ncbi:hypothetical protein [Desulfohalovibrio reitneri]|uniref:hypothetical protein n=1 Tax=Desulfohalovibrio reitneri TaxID=1307759 RepID=UPI00055920A3|nr:hypothetical protein [Desulfohalovibrio reitneri]
MSDQDDERVIHAEAETVAGEGPVQPGFDVVEMPLEGVAAYWLSLKKLCDMRRSKKVLAEEAKYTPEPFVRHLLEIGFETMPEERARAMVRAKARTVLATTRRSFDLMRLAVEAVIIKENPRLSLVRMLAHFPRPPANEERAMRRARDLAEAVTAKNADLPKLLRVGHTVPPDRQVIKLLFFILFARRRGVTALRSLLPHVGSNYFAEGIKLVADGFDPRLIDDLLRRNASASLAEASAKLRLSEEMFLAIRAKEPYSRLYLLAKSYL